MIKEYLLKIGYKESYYKKIINTPGVKDLNEDVLLYNICWNFVCFLNLGYSKNDIIKMTNKLPQIYGLTVDYIENKFKDLLKLGYTEKAVIKMTIVCPQLYSLSINDNIKKRFDDLKKFRYSDQEILSITRLLPALYTYSIDNIINKRKDLMKLDFSEEQVNFLTTELPSLYSVSIENITDKINLLKDIGLEFIIINDPKQLMQSSKLTYARYAFFKDKGIIIDKDNYRRLFYDDKAFQRSFDISNEDLLNLYDYEQYLNERKMKNGKPL